MRRAIAVLVTKAVALVAAATTSGKPGYSVDMARSIMARSQGIMTGAGGSSEPLQCGFTQKAFLALCHQYPEDEYADICDYIMKSSKSVQPYLGNASNDATAYPLDRLTDGMVPIYYTEEAHNTHSDEYHAMMQTRVALRQSIDLNARNGNGGLQYYTYPYWSYLDGMYSTAPFYALDSLPNSQNHHVANMTALHDMLHQIIVLHSRCYNNATGLLVHGYDYSGTASWAAPGTGASPHVWGRSLGWFVMALVDTTELVESYSDLYNPLKNMYRNLAIHLVHEAKPGSGWWQVMDQPYREGNYIESSGTAMFAYALLKGKRLGYLRKPGERTGNKLEVDAKKVAVAAIEYLEDNFVTKLDNGTLSWSGTVGVCSLNSTASYEYYVTQEMSPESPLGSNAFILAELEKERLDHLE